MKIRWTDPAVEALKAIRDYISLDSEYYAAVICEDILHQVENLKDFPSMGRVVPEYGQEGIREIIHLTYRIAYRLGTDSITVVNIIHSSRDFRSAMGDE